MKRYLLGSLFLVLVLLFGCIEQTYVHTLNSDGKSKISLTAEFDKFVEMSAEISGTPKDQYTDDFKENLKAYCDKIGQSEDMTCKVKNMKVVVSKNIEKTNPYYTLEVSEGMPSKEYKLTINKIPTFSSDEVKAIVGQIGDVIDLNKKDEMKQTAATYEYLIQSQGSAEYKVVMPAEVYEAYSGDYNAEINEETAVFELSKAFEEGEPFIIKAKEINLFWAYAILGLIILIVFALMLVMFRNRE